MAGICSGTKQILFTYALSPVIPGKNCICKLIYNRLDKKLYNVASCRATIWPVSNLFHLRRRQEDKCRTIMLDWSKWRFLIVVNQNFAHRQLTCWNQPWWTWLTFWCGLRYFAVMVWLAKGKSLVPLLLCTTQGHYGRERWSLGGVQNIELPVSCTADLTSFLCVYLCVFKRMSVVSGWVCWCASC